MRTLPLLAAALLGSIALAGCGSDSDPSGAAEARTTASPSSTASAPSVGRIVNGRIVTDPVATAASTTPAPAPTASAPAPPPPPAAPRKADVRTAENAVRDELPNTPYWKGYRFRGRIKNARLICVDRVPPASEVDPLVSHVMVSWPSFQTGEPKDGPCARAAQTADRAIVAARNFYLKTDDDAIALEAAVIELQNGRTSAVSKIEQIAQRLRLRLSNYPESSYGGNLLLSSAVTAAEEGAKSEPNLRRLVSVRLDINEARASLAKEIAG